MKSIFNYVFVSFIMLIFIGCGNNNKSKIKDNATAQEQEEHQLQEEQLVPEINSENTAEKATNHKDNNSLQLTEKAINNNANSSLQYPEKAKAVNEQFEIHKWLEEKPDEKTGIENEKTLKWSPKGVVEEMSAAMKSIKSEQDLYNEAYDKTLTLFKTPFTEQDIKTSFGTAHVIVSGPKNAEPIVLLHGMNASSTSWYPNIKALSQNFRVYAIDNLLEPGKSHLINDVKDMSDIIKWYGEVFDKLKLDKFSLIGASKGGWLSINIAFQHKSRIKNLILLSPAQTFVWIPPGSKMLSNITYTLAPNQQRLMLSLESMSYNVNLIEQVYIDQYYLGTQKTSFSKFVLQMRPFSDDELKSLTMPVLLLIGDHDIVNSPKSIKKANKLLPDCETSIIRNAGHFLSLDQAEKVNQLMLDFLQKKAEVRADSEG